MAPRLTLAPVVDRSRAGWIVHLALTATLLACGGGSGGSTDTSPCVSNSDCPGTQCIEGVCTTLPTDRSDARSSGALPALPSLDPPPEQPDATPSEMDATNIDDGGFLADCIRNEDCDSGYCIDTRQGRVCTARCQQDADCADAAGWRCRTVGAGGVDIEELCYPDVDDLCESCAFDDECGEVQDRCVTLDDGRFCGLSCTGGAACPIGYSCELVGEDLEQCIPVSRLCGPCRDANLATDVLHCGECNNVCAYPNGVPACDGGVCAPGGCDRGFRDCDGELATGCETAVTSDPRNCGECANVCPEATDALVACEAGECTAVSCPEGRGNCDLDSSSGCETRFEDDPDHCGGCDLACEAGVLCIGGQCGCPVGQIPCDGSCATPNTCGGCDPLAGEPLSACDNCGTWTCDGEVVLCTGQVDRLTDANNCGTCGNICRPDQTCRDGQCACPEPLIECAGACVAANSCGGCEPLPGEPLTACDNCGTWTCNGDNVVCTGQVDRLRDSSNCGTCGNICRPDQTCRDGQCACPEPLIECAGACTSPNPCGGCGPLAGDPDTPCANCGTWVCSDGAVSCTGQVNRDTDPENCGGCGISCRSDQICGGGGCRCAPDRIECGGVCVTPSACGGCDARDREIGDPCDDCGEWTCVPDGTVWTCSGQVDRLTDPDNCGTCGNACSGGSECREGHCVCPDGQIDCGGTCVPERALLLGQAFETGIAPWTTETARSSLGPWLISEEHAFEGQQSAWVRGATDAVADHRLVSPEVDLPPVAEDPELSFRMRHDISRASTSCFDGGTLDVSTNGGTTWSVVPSSQLSVPYDAVMNSGFSNPRGGQPAWCGTRTNWTRVRVDVTPWAGQRVKFRWRFTTDAAGTPREGWYIDAVRVTADGCQAGSGEQ